MIGTGLLGRGTLPVAEAVGNRSRGLGMPWPPCRLATSGTGRVYCWAAANLT